MSEITEALLKEIKKLDLERYYKEPICMLPVSKNFRGEFDLADRDRQRCEKPQCETLKALLEERGFPSVSTPQRGDRLDV